VKIAKRVRRVSQLASWLRVNVRVEHSHVEVLFCEKIQDADSGECLGMCDWPADGLCVIWIAWKGQNLTHMIDTLIHEWAHALEGCEREDEEESGHTKKWGELYATLWRTLHDENGLGASRSYPI
jgi:hypothetical protein